ncbi:ABC transporter substrate-binding protein [Microvirga puerhi]|uniref:ABC transporter substrate-binding protein n=1 Tax=Microvirga puerhi TaxID=2876078 RepID=A0ABS7VUA4_9HYPH|nr:ABC transporter substrate-binding protein [Microvirga puerhi]MBZ6078477.1 ABC transporter substrate-binding protein [Microvirga puerhi]
MKINRREFMGGALGASALAGFPMPAISQSAPIRIGCITSLVGGYSQFGQNHVRGMEIAAEAINAAGGVNGRKLEIVVRSDDLKPETAVAAARELAASGVRIFGGVNSSGVALALSGIMGELDSVLLTAAAHGNNLTHEDFRPNYFRVTDYSAMRIGAGSHLMAQRYPNVRVWGSISPDIQVGRSVVEVYNSRLPEAYRKLHNAEVQLKDTVWVKFGATDYRNEIARLISQGIEGLVIGVGGTDEATFLQQATQLGLASRLKAMYTTGSEFVAPMALKNRMPANFWSGFHWYYGAYRDNPIAKQVVETFRAKGYGQHPDGFIGMAHTVVLAIAAAMKNGAGDSSKELIPALEGLKFDTVKGPTTLRKEDHQALCDVNYALIGPANNQDGWEVIDSARIDGTPFAGDPTPGIALKFG